MASCCCSAARREHWWQGWGLVGELVRTEGVDGDGDGEGEGDGEMLERRWPQEKSVLCEVISHFFYCFPFLVRCFYFP